MVGLGYIIFILLTMSTTEPDLLQVIDMETKGIPIGRPAEVNLRNNHAQYIFTWYAFIFMLMLMLIHSSSHNRTNNSALGMD